MSNTLIIIIGILSFIVFIILSKLFIYNKWINRLINLVLFILLFILPTSIACVCFALLVVRLGIWLFGPAQDIQDNYYYSRYRNAKNRYEKNIHDNNMQKLMKIRNENRRRKNKNEKM